MKKIIKYITMILTLLIGSFIYVDNAKASTLTMNYQDNIYYVHVNSDGTGYSSYKLAMYYVDGKLAYCIEPGLGIASINYSIGSWDITSLTKSQIKQMELIGYYGYEYPTHQGNVKYYMAAQELIWKVAKPLTATWSTQKGGAGEIINIEQEKNEILALVSKYNVKPSFDNETITATIGDTITLTDTNNVLSNFSVYSDDGQDVNINGNTLNIKVNKTGSIKVQFIKLNYDSDVSLVYYNGSSQKLAHTRLSEPLRTSINISSLAGTVKINKLDKTFKVAKAQGEASLAGAVYEIYDENDNYITSITTDENGQAESTNLPSLGKYYLKEKTPSEGYTLDETKYYFEMTMEDLYPSVDVYEQVIEKTYTFTKVYASDKTGIMTSEISIYFGIYDKDGNLVVKKKTDSEGKIVVTLPYGSYTLKQLTTTKGYEKMEDYNFEVRKANETENKVFANSKIQSRLKVIKVDQDGNKIAKSGIIFKIKNLDTNKYVCQKVAYPTVQTFCEYETNDDGVLITPYPLTSGNYQLEEMDQLIDGYLWNSEPLKFTIDENSDIKESDGFDAIIELYFKNEEVKGQIEIKKVGEKLVIENNKYTYEEIKLSNVVFGLYDEDGNLISKVTTDKNGYAVFTDLKLGKYILKELSSSSDNMLDTKEYEIELKYKDQYTKTIIKTFTLKNYLSKGTLEFTKTDFSNSKGLPNTLIEIYTENDELIFSGRTDINGKITITDLPIGKYYILEKEAPTGYKLNEEKMYFEIKENNEVVKATMIDETEEIEVPNTSSNSYIDLIAGIIVLAGTSLIIVTSNKKDNKRK